MYEQNTPEWEMMRKNKLGASDAPIIMGVSPWTTPYQLWEQKLAPYEKSVANIPQQCGHDLEPMARAILEQKTGICFHPMVKTHSHLTWMIASIDAVDIGGKNIGEIKYSNAEDHEMALADKIPDKYYPQLQHQMEVFQLEMNRYFSFHPIWDKENRKWIITEESSHIVKVYRCEEYIKKLVEKETEFWEKMQSFTPPELCDRDYIPQTSTEWLEIASNWRSVQAHIKMLEKKENELRAKLIGLANDHNAQGGGVRLTKYLRKGNVDYSAIPQLENVNLEEYRKQPIESWRIISS